MAKFPDDVTLTLQNEKFPEKSRGNSNGVLFHSRIPITMKMGEIYGF